MERPLTRRKGSRRQAILVLIGLVIVFWAASMRVSYPTATDPGPVAPMMKPVTAVSSPIVAPVVSEPVLISADVLNSFGMIVHNTAVDSLPTLPLVNCRDGSYNGFSADRSIDGVLWHLQFKQANTSIVVTASRSCPATAVGVAVKWTTDQRLEELTEGPNTVLGDYWIEVHFVGTDARTGTVTIFLRPTKRCSGSASGVLMYQGQAGVPAGKYRVLGHLLFSQFDHINELMEEASFKYVGGSNPEAVNLIQRPGTLCVDVAPHEETLLHNGVHWSALQKYALNEKTGSLGGYWLSVKGEASDPSVPYFTHDILGRMNYGWSYHFANDAIGSPVCARTCILDLMRHKTVYFIGDSQMRILFYGFLTRVGISYPLNKVWRGDRTDYVSSHNVTIRYIASYFLDLNKTSPRQALQDTADTILVVGVGQHHSCHCWSLQKHLSVVNVALREITARTQSGFNSRHDVLWFGVPAQPVNRHLHLSKPVGQARRDCRNNARHLLFNEGQKQAVRAMNAKLPSSRQIIFIDAFGRSVGMSHTSLDGAHYYTWVRDAWITAIADALLTRKAREIHDVSSSLLVA